MDKRTEFVALMFAEMDKAYRKHGYAPWRRHEFYGILKEEVDELWDVIKADGPECDLDAEMLQVAMVCLRYFETKGG